MSNFKKFVIISMIILVAVPATAFGYIYFKLDSIYDGSVSKDTMDNAKDVENFIDKYGNNEGSGLEDSDIRTSKNITNILLVGTDGRSKDEKTSRSDAMMILTVDAKHNALKLTSLARDSFVEIPGHGKEKLTHAYAYGGVDLLTQTIENNFKIDVGNYAVVDFFSFMDIVDTLGGVTVDVKASELEELEKYTTECYGFDDNPNKGEIQIVQSEGVQKLNGYQTLAYSRIRYNDTAAGRDGRQRQVMESMVGGLKELPVSKYPELVNVVLPYVKTNMRPGDVLGVGAMMLGMSGFDFKQMEFPVNGVGGIVDGKGWVYQFDSDECVPVLHEFIFEE